jgi:hypothetical protein
MNILRKDRPGPPVAAKLIGAGLATIFFGLAGAGVGIGTVFGDFILFFYLLCFMLCNYWLICGSKTKKIKTIISL